MAFRLILASLLETLSVINLKSGVGTETMTIGCRSSHTQDLRCADGEAGRRPQHHRAGSGTIADVGPRIRRDPRADYSM